MFKYPCLGFFFLWVCEWHKTMEGCYFSCLDVKEPKKIILVPRFRQIKPKNKVRKSKKIGMRPFFMFKYPCLGFFPWVCEWRKTMEGHYFSCLDVKEPKNIIPVPRFRQITQIKFLFRFSCYSLNFSLPYLLTLKIQHLIT